MSRTEVSVRFLPVVAFVLVTLLVLIISPEPSLGIPLLGAQGVLLVLSIVAWIPHKHRGKAAEHSE